MAIATRTSRVANLVAKGTFELQELPLPDIGPDEGLLRVERAGICGSDVLQLRGDTRSAWSTIPGHEPVGVIAEIGERAAARWGVARGDRVIVKAAVPCLRCAGCHTGDFDRCTDRRVYGRTATTVAPGLWGAFSEYMYLHPNTFLYKISRDVPLEIAATFNAVACGVEWTGDAEVSLGQTVVILGAGQRGLACVLAAKTRGATTIIVTGLARDRYKLDLALELGADHAIDVERESVSERVREITGGAMADVVLDLVPYDTETVVDAVDSVREHGLVFIAGRNGPDSRVRGLVVDRIVERGVRIHGTHGKDNESYRQAVKLMEQHRPGLEKLPTHTFALDRAHEAIATLAGDVPGERAVCVSLAIDA